MHGISILGRFDDRVADGLLGRKGINGEYRVRVAVADDRQIGGKNKALDAPAVDDDAAGRIDLRRDLQNIVPKLAFHCRKGGACFHTSASPLFEFEKKRRKREGFPNRTFSIPRFAPFPNRHPGENAQVLHIWEKMTVSGINQSLFGFYPKNPDSAQAIRIFRPYCFF